VTELENFAPGPLPVIHAICQECGLIEVIDEIVEWDQDQADISPEDLYDQRFGWALDKIADAGARQVLNSVIAKAITTEGVDIGVVHADTTSKSVHGEYEQDGEPDGLTYGNAAAGTNHRCR
jgi:transposase